MVVCDVCKRNKATRKITYPTIVPMEYDIEFHGVDLFRTTHGCKIENTEYDVCQECWYAFATNRSYVFQLAKEMIYNKVNESEVNEE